MKIVLKGCPPSLNQFAGRENVWSYRQEKARWTQAVRIISLKDRPKKPYGFAEVRIKYYFPTKARHDADNYAGKFLLDGLTKAGIIVDDDFKHIRLNISGECDKNNPRTEIEVEEVMK